MESKFCSTSKSGIHSITYYSMKLSLSRFHKYIKKQFKQECNIYKYLNYKY